MGLFSRKKSETAPKTPPEPEYYRYAQLIGPGDGEWKNLADDAKIAHLAYCVAEQQRAGFRTYLDLRETYCPCCGSPGYNTGWGVWDFVCGAEIHTDGEPCKPCGRATEEPGQTRAPHDGEVARAKPEDTTALNPTGSEGERG